MNVLVPCGGLYSRFPSAGMPKYLRPLNDMRPMICWALDSVRTLEPTEPLNLFIAIRKQDAEEWRVTEVLQEYEPSARIMVLPEETQGQAHTVEMMLENFGIFESFLVKDSDCYWRPANGWTSQANAIVVGWRETAVGDRGTKSWVVIKRESGLDWVEWIEEKKTPTDWYCCGGYQFSSPTQFCQTTKRLRSEVTNEIYCSHVIQQMIESGGMFRIVECRELHDWGTWDKYVSWRQERKIYFFDLDGVITTAGAPYGKNLWKDSSVLPGVREKLTELKKKGGTIYIVTSRPLRVAAETECILTAAKVPYDHIIFGLPNGPRVMVNDYAASNPYPSVEAVNTKRDSADWLNLLR